MSATTVDSSTGNSSSTPPGIDKSRRTWIAITCGATAVGGVAVAVPFVSTFATRSGSPKQNQQESAHEFFVRVQGVRP